LQDTIRVGDEATLEASGMSFRIVTVDEFNQRVEIELLRNGERAKIPTSSCFWW
jgi:hypothetical protein